MTVGEIICELEKFPKEMPVYEEFEGDHGCIEANRFRVGRNKRPESGGELALLIDVGYYI